MPSVGGRVALLRSYRLQEMDESNPQALARIGGSGFARADLMRFRRRFERLLLSYQFGMDEVLTKINILKTEFEHLHDYSPIEHVSSRLKSAESTLAKAKRRQESVSLASLRDITDIAGIRIVCSFITDVYWIAKMLTQQADITVIEVKDYIENPKPNGYKSLHLILKVPVFLSDSVEDITVEVQVRTVAMDFWASLEHKIYYKYDKDVPGELLAELVNAAAVANQLDLTMERLHTEVRGGRAEPPVADADEDELHDRLIEQFLGAD